MTDAGRRTLTLRDRFVDQIDVDANHVRPSAVARLRALARVARQFVLTPAACRAAATVLRDVPDLLVREQAFARAPYETTWIELSDMIGWWETINPGLRCNPDADAQVAYLVHSDVVHVFAASRRSWDLAETRPMLRAASGTSCAVGFLSFELHRPWLPEEQLRFCETFHTSRAQLDTFMWGSIGRSISQQHQRDLRDSNTARLVPLTVDLTAERYQRSGALEAILYNGMQDVRNVLVLLLLLNRPALTHLEHVDSIRSFHRGRSIQYRAHSVVTLPLDPLPLVRYVGGEPGKGSERRRHEVRGHWCHDETARAYGEIGCVHEWERVTDFGTPGVENPKRFRCRVCGGKRWWQTDYVRGSAVVGYVDKTYSVRSRGQ